MFLVKGPRREVRRTPLRQIKAFTAQEGHLHRRRLDRLSRRRRPENPGGGPTAPILR